MANNKLYNIKMKRYASNKEYLLLQGYPLNYNIIVSNNQFTKQIGNSMSVNVLIFLFKNIFQTVKLI